MIFGCWPIVQCTVIKFALLTTLTISLNSHIAIMYSWYPFIYDHRKSTVRVEITVSCNQIFTWYIHVHSMRSEIQLHHRGIIFYSYNCGIGSMRYSTFSISWTLGICFIVSPSFSINKSYTISIFLLLINIIPCPQIWILKPEIDTISV